MLCIWLLFWICDDLQSTELYPLTRKNGNAESKGVFPRIRKHTQLGRFLLARKHIRNVIYNTLSVGVTAGNDKWPDSEEIRRLLKSGRQLLLLLLGQGFPGNTKRSECHVVHYFRTFFGFLT